MTLKDEIEYRNEDRQDLVARLMAAQTLDRFLFRAYDALRNYSVDFKAMPEWDKAVEDFEAARKLKPHRAQEAIIAALMVLDHALTAAIRRKQFRLQGVKPLKDDA